MTSEEQTEFCRRLSATKLTAAEFAEACRRLSEIANRVPFPEGEELRQLLLRRWKAQHGWLRFLCLGYWRDRIRR